MNWQFPFYIYDQGTNIGGYVPKNLRLGYWRFNTSSLTNQAGEPVSIYPNVAFSNSFSGYSVGFNNDSSELVYNAEYNGNPVFDPSNGTVRFYFQPNWNSDGSGAPPPPYGAWLFGITNSAGSWQIAIGGDGASLSLVAVSNQFSANQSLGYFDCPVDFQAGLWYQIALTYSPRNIACYVNGSLVSAAFAPTEAYDTTPLFNYGGGMVFYPPISNPSAISIGNEVGQSVPVLGQIDEVETFNYPLSAKAIGYDFPYFGGATNVKQDTDYDGVSDLLESNVYGTIWTNAGSAPQLRLGYWRFDTSDLIGEEGQIPISSSGVSQTPSWSGTALNIGPGTSHVTYNDVSSNGWAHVNCRQGTLRFWYMPNTTGITGTFLYMGDSAEDDVWTLQLSGGNEVLFATQTNSISYTSVLAAHIPTLSTTNWTQFVLTYGPTNSALWVNGVEYTGSGNTNWPRPSYRALGMVIGNNAALNSPINGQIDELETFNYQLAASDIASNFQAVASIDSDLDGTPDLLQDTTYASSRPFLGQPVSITGTVEAEQFDLGGREVAYHSLDYGPTNGYRAARMAITPCNDVLNTTNVPTFGYCLDQTRAGEWVNYTINVLTGQTDTVEARVAGIGTNGWFSCTVSNAALGAYASTGPLMIPTTNWTLVATNLYLAAGTNVMTLHFLTNGMNNNITGTNCGRFNYISLYPYWALPKQWTGTNYANSNYVSPSLLSNGSDFVSASNNAYIIQSNVNALPSGGGMVQIPSGTYYLAQAAPNEAAPAYVNAAVAVLGNNVEIAGAGKGSTTLIAYNRATTIISIAANQGGLSKPCSDFTLRDMTMVARTHEAVNNPAGTNITGTQITYDTNVFVAGDGFVPPDDRNTDVLVGVSAGIPVVLFGFDEIEWPHNILITNCQFIGGWDQIDLADDPVPVFYAGASNILITACDFDWGGTNFGSVDTNFGNVGIWGNGDNVLVVSNKFNGNTNFGWLTYAQVSANPTLETPESAVGLVCLQQGGNWFVARNIIHNYYFEGVAHGGGPASIVGNTYSNLQNDASSCALNALGGGYDVLNLLTNPPGHSTTFVGNFINGGRWGELGDSWAGVPYPFIINYSGNYTQVYPPADGAGGAPGAAVCVLHASLTSLVGNTLGAGGYGLFFTGTNVNAILMDNDFHAAAYRGVGYETIGDIITSAQIFGDSLGCGSTFDLQIPWQSSFGWFVRQNSFVNSTSNTIPAFFDPLQSAAHFNR